MLFVAIVLGLRYGPAAVFNWVIERYAQTRPDLPLTGHQVARRLLDAAHLKDVRIEELPANVPDLGDCYLPKERLVRLSPRIARGRSVAAYAVAAHEVGHACQYADGYDWTALFRPIAKFTGFTIPIMLGLFLLVAAYSLLSGNDPDDKVTWIVGAFLVVFYGSDVVMRLLAVPIEWNASFGHALPMLISTHLLPPRYVDDVRTILFVAASTYGAFALLGLVTIAVLLTS